MRELTNLWILAGTAALALALTCPAAAEGETAEVGTLPLPSPAGIGSVSVEEAIGARRSIRSFKDTPISPAQISQLLWSVQGITETTRGLRAAPSAGATYPLEIYLAKADGLFRYVPVGHKLKVVGDDDVRAGLSAAAYGQRWVAQAPVSVIIAAVEQRTSRKYGDRARRYVDMEAGCASENLALQAVALGLGTVIVGGFDDAEVSSILGCPAGEAPLMILPVGVPAK